jgi:malate synthase
MNFSRLTTTALPEGVQISAALDPAWSEILSFDALAFVAKLSRAFEPTRRQLLARRGRVQARLDAGLKPDFLAETAHVRALDWKVAPPPPDLLDRRVEITGPTDRKMIINALNSGANVFMADFEDSNAPTWRNIVEGQVNLRDAVRGTIAYVNPSTDKSYRLNEKTATLVVRPRGWHLVENHVSIDGSPVSASLFDFALYFFHNAEALRRKGTGPYFYLPKMESHLEARLWNDVFVRAESELAIPRGTIRATVLVETILAAFEMDEILYELREHSSGLNCGRWDYIFSFIKKFSNDPACVLPDRALVGMTEHFLRSYSLLLIKTCHRRGAHAMGGMAAQIPIKDDPAKNAAAIAKVEADKRREVADGHDGTWVAHPGLVATARAIFDAGMRGPNQLDRTRADVDVRAEDLLRVPSGPITEEGLRLNVRVGVQYLAAWLSGQGCVPLYGLMEDAATAEISRAQVWQWIRHGARLSDPSTANTGVAITGGAHGSGRVVTTQLFHDVLKSELEHIENGGAETAFAPGRLQRAAMLFDRLSTAPAFPDFLTVPAYDQLLDLAT